MKIKSALFQVSLEANVYDSTIMTELIEKLVCLNVQLNVFLFE